MVNQHNTAMISVDVLHALNLQRNTYQLSYLNDAPWRDSDGGEKGRTSLKQTNEKFHVEGFLCEHFCRLFDGKTALIIQRRGCGESWTGHMFSSLHKSGASSLNPQKLSNAPYGVWNMPHINYINKQTHSSTSASERTLNYLWKLLNYKRTFFGAFGLFNSHPQSIFINLQCISVVARSWKHQRNRQNGCKQRRHGENNKLHDVLDPIWHGEKNDSHKGESE